MIRINRRPSHELSSKSQDFAPLSDHPLVTIVVPSLNQGDYIKDTIESVLNQDYEALELLIIDGGSTDDTLDIIRSYESDSRLKWLSEPDDGTNDAYDKGLKLANGDLIGFQNSSDTYQPGAVSKAVLEFLADPMLAMVAGRTQEIDTQGVPTGVTWDGPDQKRYVCLDEILGLGGKIYPPGQSTFIRRDIAIAIGGLESEYHRWLLTYFHLHYMLEAFKLKSNLLHVPQVWGNYRRHPNPLHDAFLDKQIGLTVVRHQNLACKQISKQYKDYLTQKQVRDLRRLGCLKEFRYRVGTLQQIGRAMPALLGYLRFGGKFGDRELRPQLKGSLSYLFCLIKSHFRAAGATKRADSSRIKPSGRDGA